jgi:hypothetical protein
VDELDRIQAWHKAQCERGREPKRGVRIEPLHDAPGWTVRIDVSDTPLANLHVPPYKEGAGARDWLMYRLKDGSFDGAGDPTKLRALLFAFLELVDRASTKKR